MISDLGRVGVDWRRVLVEIHELAQGAGPRGLLVFDLDSTVLDNRPRQARIVREFGQAKDLPQLTKCQPWHFTSGWDLRGAMRSCGLAALQSEALYSDLKAFWQERFFTSEYCQHDIEIVGAPRFLHALVEVKARIAYVTGRHEGMRSGTESCLGRCRMPRPEPQSVRLMMKPDAFGDDDGFKRQAHQQLMEMGTVLAVFDNEPTHINDYAERFPAAIPVHLATDHSGREVHLNPRCVSIPHFAI